MSINEDKSWTQKPTLISCPHCSKDILLLQTIMTGMSVEVMTDQLREQLTKIWKGLPPHEEETT